MQSTIKISEETETRRNENKKKWKHEEMKTRRNESFKNRKQEQLKKLGSPKNKT